MIVFFLEPARMPGSLPVWSVYGGGRCKIIAATPPTPALKRKLIARGDAVKHALTASFTTLHI
jgi:hypothetical protein